MDTFMSARACEIAAITPIPSSVTIWSFASYSSLPCEFVVVSFSHSAATHLEMLSSIFLDETTLGQSDLWTDTPKPRVIKPTILSPGSGLQHFANFTWHPCSPSIIIPPTCFFFIEDVFMFFATSSRTVLFSLLVIGLLDWSDGSGLPSLHDLVLAGYVILRISPFLLGCPGNWQIAVHSILI